MPLVTIFNIPLKIYRARFKKYLKEQTGMNLFLSDYDKGEKCITCKVEVDEGQSLFLRELLSGANLEGSVLSVSIQQGEYAKQTFKRPKYACDNAHLLRFVDANTGRYEFSKIESTPLHNKKADQTQPHQDSSETQQKPQEQKGLPEPHEYKDPANPQEQTGPQSAQPQGLSSWAPAYGAQPALINFDPLKRMKLENESLDIRLEMIRKERLLLEEQRKLLEEKRMLESLQNMSPVRARIRKSRSSSRDGHSSRNRMRRSRSPMRGSPVRESPMRGSPVRKSPMRRSPVRKSPMRRSPVRKSPMRRSQVRKSPMGRSPMHSKEHSRSQSFNSKSQSRSPQRRRDMYRSRSPPSRSISPHRALRYRENAYRERSPRNRERRTSSRYSSSRSSPERSKSPSPMILCSDSPGKYYSAGACKTSPPRKAYEESPAIQKNTEPLKVGLPTKTPAVPQNDHRPWTNAQKPEDHGSSQKVTAPDPPTWLDASTGIAKNPDSGQAKLEACLKRATEYVIKSQLEAKFPNLKLVDNQFEGKFNQILAAVILKRMQRIVNPCDISTNTLVRNYKVAFPADTNQALVATVAAKLSSQFGVALLHPLTPAPATDPQYSAQIYIEKPPMQYPQHQSRGKNAAAKKH